MPIVVSMLRPPLMAHRLGTITEMGRYDLASGKLRVVFGEDASDPFIGKSVKAVPANALIPEFPRKRIGPEQRMLPRVKGGIKASNVDRLRG